jgi:predicted membrane chloride channel (bestrophin family)
MNIYLEIILRALSVFLGVFFTVSWGRKSKPVWDVAIILAVIALALYLAFRQNVETYSPPLKVYSNI